MYRHRAYQQIVYGHFNEFLKTVEELNAVNRAFQADAEAMKTFRGMAGIVVQGSAHDEIFEQVSRPLA